MMAAYMRQRYKLERTTDINEQEEAEVAVKKIRKRGYGVGRVTGRSAEERIHSVLGLIWMTAC